MSLTTLGCSGVGAAGPFNALSAAYSGLTNEIWLSASDASTLLDAGAAAADLTEEVATWNDKSGNARNFAGVATARPTRQTNTNGSATFDSMRFDATNDRMVAASALGCARNKGCLVFAWSGRYTQVAATIGIFTVYTPSAGTARIRPSMNSDGQWNLEGRRLDADSGSSAFSGVGTLYTSAQWGVHLFLYDFQADSWSVYYNKVAKIAAVALGSSTAGNTSDTDSAASGVFVGSYASGSGFAAKDMVDVCLWSASSTPSAGVLDAIQTDMARTIGVSI